MSAQVRPQSAVSGQTPALLPPSNSTPSSRREFLHSTGLAAATCALGPLFLHASDKGGTKAATVGTGAHVYECDHQWGQLPKHVQWGETHGVAVDSQGLVYLKHRSSVEMPMDSIVVFDPAGKFVRSFGKEYHGGGHGIDIRREGNEEFLYLCDVKNGIVAKTTLLGEQIWKLSYPLEAHKYKVVKQFSPTNVAFAPDGGFYIGDGYGSNYIHQYDRDAKWIRTFGGTGKKLGELRTPHGLWLDDRPGRTPALVVADRANNRLQYFSLDGQPLSEIVDPESFPAHFDIRGTVLMVPDLFARITLYDKDNQVITHLGNDPVWIKKALAKNKKGSFVMRTEPQHWEQGRFIHPHDACFDAAGNIYVAEWVPMGRVSKLTLKS